MKTWRAALYIGLTAFVLGCGGSGIDGGDRIVDGPIEGLWSGDVVSTARTVGTEGVPTTEVGDIRVRFEVDQELQEFTGVLAVENETETEVFPIDSGSYEGNSMTFYFGPYVFNGSIPENQSPENADLIEGTIFFSGGRVGGDTFDIGLDGTEVTLRRRSNNEDPPAEVGGLYAGTLTSNSNDTDDIELYIDEDDGYLSGEFNHDGFFGYFDGAAFGDDFVTGDFVYDEDGFTGHFVGTIEPNGRIHGTYTIYEFGTETDSGTFSWNVVTDVARSSALRQRSESRAKK